MWSIEEAFVISDLHLAAEHGCGLFRADEQLADFLHYVRQDFSHSHLYLNGDVFDFLVSQDRETELDTDRAANQAADIASNHSKVFDQLGLLASSVDHGMTILGGNHDPEMVLPDVQREIDRHLKLASGRSPIRWLTNGEAESVQIGNLKVLIEHGDQYDSWNWVDHEALRRVVCLISRNVTHEGVYRASPGSRLVVNRLNLLRDQFPWLQTLQPISAAMIPLALEVILPLVPREDRLPLIKAVKEVNGFGVRSAVDQTLLSMGALSEYWANDDSERLLLNEWLAEYERTEEVWSGDDDKSGWFKRAMRRVRSHFANRQLKGLADRSTFFDIDAEDENYKAVTRLVSKGAGLVVHGHTHAAKAYPVGNGLYINSGTWGQLTKWPVIGTNDEKWAEFMENLRVRQVDSFPRLTFVHIKKQGSDTSATLSEWTDQGVQALSDWTFANSGWEKR